MELTVDQEEGVTVVRAMGDLNAANAGQLEASLGHLTAKGARRIVLDLGEVRYVASAGLRVFLLMARDLGKDGAFALARPAPPVRQVLDMTRFSDIITIRDTVGEAVAAIGGGQPG